MRAFCSWRRGFWPPDSFLQLNFRYSCFATYTVVHWQSRSRRSKYSWTGSGSPLNCYLFVRVNTFCRFFVIMNVRLFGQNRMTGTIAFTEKPHSTNVFGLEITYDVTSGDLCMWKQINMYQSETQHRIYVPATTKKYEKFQPRQSCVLVEIWPKQFKVQTILNLSKTES
jgi:hypothetical protein